jgi:hypothetical protein
MNIDNIYKPYNYSQYSVYVVQIEIANAAVTKIEQQLPLHIKKLTGIYITCNSNTKERVIGYITLNFNDGILKTVQLPIINCRYIQHHSHPLPINETLNTNSNFQGYFYSRITPKAPFKLSIYLHYEKM